VTTCAIADDASLVTTLLPPLVTSFTVTTLPHVRW
jgi:hypothetical protein